MQRVWVVLLGVVALLASGCGVSKDQYMRLENDKKKLEQNVNDLSRQVDQLSREKEELAYFNQNLQTENRRLLQTRESLEREMKTEEAGTEEESPLK